MQDIYSNRTLISVCGLLMVPRLPVQRIVATIHSRLHELNLLLPGLTSSLDGIAGGEDLQVVDVKFVIQKGNLVLFNLSFKLNIQIARLVSPQ